MLSGGGLVPFFWMGGVSALFLAGLLQYLLYRRLRVRHPDAWREIGMPHFVDYREYIGAMGSFVWRGRYRSLQDPVATAMAVATKILTVAFGVSFLGIVASILGGH